MNPDAVTAAAAYVPMRARYYPSPGQVAVLGGQVRADPGIGREILDLDGPCAVISPSKDERALRAAGFQIGTLSDHLATGAEWVIVGYGAEGGRIARHVRDGLIASGADIGGEARVHDDGRIAVVPDHLRAAFPDRHVPDADLVYLPAPHNLEAGLAESAYRGHPAPAASRADYVDRYRPATEPIYPAPGGSEKRQLLAQPPSRRREVILAGLEELAASHQPDRQRAGRTAFLIHSDRSLRDRICADVFDDPERTEALLQLYRGADPSMRPGLAGAAATTQFTTDMSSVAPMQIAADNPTDTLSQLVGQGAAQGISPAGLKGMLLDGIPTVRDLDEQWLREQRTRASAAFPQPARDALAPRTGTQADVDVARPRQQPGRNQDSGAGR